MALVKSLQLTQFTLANTGNVQIQPIKTFSYSLTKQTLVDSTKVPAIDVPLISTLVKNDETSILKTMVSLSDTMNEIKNNPQFILNQPKENEMISANLGLNYTASSKKVLSQPSKGIESLELYKKIEPFEQLTGINSERPEVIAISQFLPLFENSALTSLPSFSTMLSNAGIINEFTPAGVFFDTQLNLMNLKALNAKKTVSRISISDFLVNKQMSEQRKQLEKHLDSLGALTTFLFGIVKKADTLKNQLDLRDEVYVVDVSKKLKSLHTPGTNENSAVNSESFKELKTLIAGQLPQYFDVSDSLIRLGYSSNYVKENFLSTKVWLQLLHELKTILEHHSLELIDAVPASKKSDASSTTINKNTVNYFQFSPQNEPESLPSIKQLAQQTDNILNVVQLLKFTYESLYEKVVFKSDDIQLAALFNLISKENAYSVGFGDKELNTQLSQQFGYTVTNDNIDVFDAIIGNVGKNIFDNVQETKSLSALAHRFAPNNVEVLTFEPKYVENYAGVMTPGSEYFVDDVFGKTDGQNFNTKNLDELSDLMSKSADAFMKVVEKFNLLSYKSETLLLIGSDASNFSFTLSNPLSFFNYVTNHFVHKETGTVHKNVQDDKLALLYCAAAKNRHLKSLLFWLTINKIVKPQTMIIKKLGIQTTSDNSPTNAKLRTQIISILTSLYSNVDPKQFQKNTKDSEYNSTDITNETLQTALSKGTALSDIVEKMMKAVLTEINQRSLSDESKTRHSNQLDTVYMMAVFDAILLTMSKFVNQQAMGTYKIEKKVTTTYEEGTKTQIDFYKSGGSYTKQVPTKKEIKTIDPEKIAFVVAKSISNKQVAVDTIKTKIDKEVALRCQLIFSVAHALNTLGNSAKSMSQYLKTEESIGYLRALNVLLGDINLLRMLLTEQQIMMLKAHVSDIRSRFKSSPALNAETNDIDGDGDFDVNDEFRLLDDLLISPKLRNAMYGLFGINEFGSKKASNKKILTFGIPAGFSRKLKQKISTKKVLSVPQKGSKSHNKQEDIVSVCVYKVDLLHQDIVYKPQKYLFELSRFPARNDQFIKSISEKPTLDDILSAIPTVDYQEGAEEDNVDISYWSSKNNAEFNSLNAPSYEFLSQFEKEQIIKNHIFSHLLEVYIRIMTGISYSEYHFNMKKPPKLQVSPIMAKLVDSKVFDVVTKKPSQTNDVLKSGGIVFTTTQKKMLSQPKKKMLSSPSPTPQTSNTSGTPGNVSTFLQLNVVKNNQTQTKKSTQVPSSESTLPDASNNNIITLMNVMSTMSYISNVQSTISDGIALSKELIAPKTFDRVFNLIVDPDDFEIDYDKTMQSSQGKIALKQLIERGDVVSVETILTNKSVSSTSAASKFLFNKGAVGKLNTMNQNFKFKDRDKGSGDVALEKYFIAIETYGGDVI